MFLLPLLWKGAAMLASVIVAMQYSGLTVDILGSKFNFQATLGSSTEWFQRTLDWPFWPSVISGGDVLHVKANRFQDMPYVPIPIIDPHLVLPLGHGIMCFKDDEGEEPPLIEYDWFDFDVEGIVRGPVALPMLEPVEHVPVPLVYYLRRTSIGLLGYDPAPTPLHGLCVLIFIFNNIGTAVFITLIWRMRQEERREAREYWRNHRSNLFPLFYQLVGPRYGTEFWAEHRDLAAPRRPDFPALYREPETWWGKLVEYFTPETVPPIPPEDLPFR
ncbi:hypothetical protein DAEQUDRAFT_764179 [Daedalea quercina L-15889]|uniref:Uncharacterized protein n=1 Tax=Daedalea quercina L-15889 TaxID=1314783 RepID=A0A165RM12_9APHY|nr:hypothetical protein DAEQUDRAFT_764179 [Daedalea quercina L-15889]